MSPGQLVDQHTDHVFPLGYERMTLGRHEDNSMILTDPQVSRHHAEIAMEHGKWVIRDLGSANGTYVNGERITEPQVLNPGDTIGLGQITFQVELSIPLSEQDTLVERLHPAASLTSAASNIPWLGVALGAVAGIVLVVIGALLLWSWTSDGEEATPPAATMQSTLVVVGATATKAGDTPLPLRPTATAIPTIPPPSPEPTRPSLIVVRPPISPTPVPKPVIGYFRAEGSTIEPGQCARLEWGEMEHVNSVTLTDVGRVNPSGKIDVCPDATKTYTLKAAGGGGATEESIQITVQPSIGPIIEYFRVVPSIISPGDCAQLEWGKVEHAISASIGPGIGEVGTPGNREVCPGSTTTYVITAENPESTTAARTTLIVSDESVQKPVISFFTANPASIRAGECTTLGWGKVDYAVSVTIDQGIGGVATPGSKEVCLITTTTYLMIAQGPGGTTDYSLTVNVSAGQLADLPDLVIESILFEPNPCYWGRTCKVRLKVRNDGSADAGHFMVRWAPSGEDVVPVGWDVDGLKAGQEKELRYNWIPDRVDDMWKTLAVADARDEVAEIEEGAANALEQFVAVLEP